MSVPFSRRGHQCDGVIAPATRASLGFLLAATLFSGTAAGATRAAAVGAPQMREGSRISSALKAPRTSRAGVVRRSFKYGAATGTITSYPVPTPASLPVDIKPGPDGNLYFTEMIGNKIGEIDPTTHQITEYPVPVPLCIPYAMKG